MESIALDYAGKYLFVGNQDAPNDLYLWCVPIREMNRTERQALARALAAYGKGCQTSEDVQLITAELPSVRW